MGPPGVGKGTQAKILKEKLGIAHISTGELLRAEIDNDTKIGKIAKRYIDQGNLVSDNLILEIVKDRITKHYFLPSQLNKEDRLVIHISKMSAF